MNKVLIITYYWPPAGGPGVQRWLKFSKYLVGQGWIPIILTVDNGTYHAVDYSLVDETQGILVYRTKTLEPYTLYNKLKGGSNNIVEEMSGDLFAPQSLTDRVSSCISNFIRSNIFIPDARKYWRRYAVSKATEIMKLHDINVAVTTGPPHSTHLIGLKIKQKFKVKWLIDFRDPWINSAHDTLLRPLKLSKKINQQYENKILDKADALVVVSQGMKNEYAHRNRNIHVIYNGFDDDDFRASNNESKAHKFILSYVGNFKIMQNYKPLWESISKFLVKNNITPSIFEINFTGNVNALVKKSIEYYGLSKYARFDGYLPHSRTVEKMKNADLLLFLNSNLPGIGKYISGKIFEYLASGTPILAIAPIDGDANKLLISCDRERAFDFSEMPELIESLNKHYRKWVRNKGQQSKYHINSVMAYSRLNQTKILCSLLNTLIENKYV